jgi:hypothetical protein
MAARRVDPPNTPPARLPAPQAAAEVSRAKPNATPAGNIANPLTRPPAKKPGSGDERPATKDAKRASGGKRASHEPQQVGAPTARVVRPAKRAGSEGAESHDPWASAGLRNDLFEFTAPASGLPPPRGAETVAILRDLLAMLPTLPDDFGELAESALSQEIAWWLRANRTLWQSVVR